MIWIFWGILPWGVVLFLIHYVGIRLRLWILCVPVCRGRSVAFFGRVPLIYSGRIVSSTLIFVISTMTISMTKIRSSWTRFPVKSSSCALNVPRTVTRVSKQTISITGWNYKKRRRKTELSFVADGQINITL